MSMSTRCRACLYKKRKACPVGCVFAPVFPGFEHVQRFGIISDVFHEKKLERWILTTDPRDLPMLLDSLEYEARARLENPITGSSGQVRRLTEENQKLRQDMERLTAEIVTLREITAKQRQEQHHEQVWSV
ncbi:hypothetical protein L6452_41300 [Arctium lappa]|uniref:Uncharacterized protein n=1 Tax=Arctium lappa TaxID=4217 RepID=A0ACB8XN43_ARCLA|nr:hypothetical protein L6452_41300 [Arctium lappa]